MSSSVGASWLLLLFSQAATPSVTACDKHDGIVDQSGSGAWEENPLEVDEGSAAVFLAGFAFPAGSCVHVEISQVPFFFFFFIGSSVVQTASLSLHHATAETDDTGAALQRSCRRHTQLLPSLPD